MRQIQPWDWITAAEITNVPAKLSAEQSEGRLDNTVLAPPAYIIPRMAAHHFDLWPYLIVYSGQHVGGLTVPYVALRGSWRPEQWSSLWADTSRSRRAGITL